MMDNKGRLVEALVYPSLYFLCAMGALYIAQGEDGIAAFWPASGVFVAGLLLAPPTHRSWLIGGVALASLVANLWSGVPIISSVGYTIANIIEGLIVFGLMGAKRRASYAEPAIMLRFVGSIVVGGCASAGMAGILSGNFDPEFLWSWASTVILGMATVVPTIMFLVQDGPGRRRLVSLRGVLALLMIAGLSTLAFAQSTYPLLFLPLVGLAFATILVGLAGTAMSLVIVTLIGSWLTVHELGPVSVFFDTVREQVLYFQAYLVGLIASILPLSVVLSRYQHEADQNRRLAETDYLTGLANRRKIIADLADQMQDARDEGGTLTIAMIDLDHFKAINDRFGHVKGDRILSTLADMMWDELGKTGKLGRLGGEEFLATFYDADVEDVVPPCEKLRRRVADYEWPADGPERVTLSIGIATFDPIQVLPGDFLREADAALYRAKESGRNCTLVRDAHGAHAVALPGKEDAVA